MWNVVKLINSGEPRQQDKQSQKLFLLAMVNKIKGIVTMNIRASIIGLLLTQL